MRRNSSRNKFLVKEKKSGPNVIEFRISVIEEGFFPEGRSQIQTIDSDAPPPMVDFEYDLTKQAFVSLSLMRLSPQSLEEDDKQRRKLQVSRAVDKEGSVAAANPIGPLE